MTRNNFEYQEAGISKKPKLNFKQYKVNLIFQCYLILTIEFAISIYPLHFSGYCEQKQTIITKCMVYNGLIHQCGKGLSLSIHKKGNNL